MFNDIQKQIEKKNKEEVEKQTAERMKLVQETADAILALAKEKGLKIQETMFAMKMVDQRIQTHFSTTEITAIESKA